MAYLKSFATTFVWVSTILAVITFIPGLPPYTEFSPYNFTLPVAINNKLNDKLNGAEKLFEGDIKGPEAFDSYDGILYTTMHRGGVYKLVENKFVKVVKFGEDCDGFWEEDKCGRPLGLKFDKRGMLYVVDSYYGIFKVDVRSGKYEKIIDISLPIEGKVPMLPNSIDVTSNGDFFWTDSSTDFELYNGLLASLCNPSGRLIRYNVATKQNEVLLKNLAFANGVRLSDDESFVLVAETVTSRVIKYYLKGPHAGKSEIFIEGLPGFPDNIDSDGQGNFLINLISTADEEHPQLIQSLAMHPNLRKMIVRTVVLLQAPFKFLEKVYPNYYSKRIVHWLGHFESAHSFFVTNFAVLKIDRNGKILDILNASDGNINTISSAFPFGDYLYLGSPFNEYIARVPLNKALPDVKKNLKDEPRIISKKSLPVIEKPTEVPTSTGRQVPPSTPMSRVETVATEKSLPPPSPTKTPVPITSAPAPSSSPTTTPPSSSPVQPPRVNSEYKAPVVPEIPTVSRLEKTPEVPTPTKIPNIKPVEKPKPMEKPVVQQFVEKEVRQPGKTIVKDEM